MLFICIINFEIYLPGQNLRDQNILDGNNTNDFNYSLENSFKTEFIGSYADSVIIFLNSFITCVDNISIRNIYIKRDA